MTDALMAVAGGLGALARFELASFVAARLTGKFPFGTLTVNIVGAFLTGLAASSGLGADIQRVVVTGFLGGFTTFSTWMVETARLAVDGAGWRGALLNIASMLVFGLIGATLGLALA